MARAHAFSSASWGTSIRNLAIARNLLSLIPLSARVFCSLGARHPLPDSPRITFRQAADVAVFERPLGPQDDHGRLFAVGRHRGVVVVFPGDMDDPEYPSGSTHPVGVRVPIRIMVKDWRPRQGESGDRKLAMTL